MSGTHRCLKCDGELGGDGLGGFCPRCIGQVAFAPAERNAGDASAQVPSQVRFLGDYELLEEIARGGMGVVFKARQLSLNRTVAVKMILSGQLASVSDVQRFRAEAEAAADLQHPNIVAIHEVGEQDGHHFFSMDYVEGRSLAQLAQEAPMPSARAAACIKTVAEAIEFAHQHGTLHRDLKPSNVVIDKAGQPRITDFGLAKRAKQDSDLTVTGQVLGTPAFMPPEQAVGKGAQLGPWTDVYSLGATLYYLLTSRPPFSAATPSETLAQVTGSEPRPVRKLNRRVPRDLETICLKCLEKDPRRRYDSARQLAEDLDRFLEDKPIQARPVSGPEKLWRKCRQHPVVTVLLLVIVLLLGVLMRLLIPEPQVPNLTLRSAQGGSGVIDGKLYVTTPVDGYSQGGRDYLHVCNPRRCTWEQLPKSPLPLPHVNSAAAVIGRHFYLAGGEDWRGNRTGELDVFDSRSQQWTRAAPMPTPRSTCGGSGLNGRLYVCGGYDGTNVLATMESYDPLTDRWTVEPSIPTARANLSTVSFQGRLYAISGMGAGQRRLTTVEIYDPKTRLWTVGPVLPQPAVCAAAAVYKNTIYIAGGWANELNEGADFFALEFPSNRWRKLPPMPEPRRNTDGAQILYGCLYVIGGWRSLEANGDHGLPHNDVFKFDIAKGVWDKPTLSR